MNEVPPRYETHIGRAKAKPSHCPVCGVSSECALPVNDIFGALKAIYLHPNRVFPREVPGWRGFKTWFFECSHVSAIDQLLYQKSNPLVDLFPRKTDFPGGNYMIPIPLLRSRSDP